MGSFVRAFKFGFVCAALAAVATCGASVVLDAPGHAAPEGMAITARGGEPGAQWRLVDWRGREVEGAAGAFDAEGNAALPPLPAGYYRMVDARSTPPGGFTATPLSEGGNDTGNSPLREGGDPEGDGGSTPSIATNRTLATLAIVPPPLSREATLRPRSGHLSGEAALNGGEAASSAFAADTASTWISRPGAFLCPWNDGDTERTVADLVRLCGFRHVRDRLRWWSAQPSPDAPPDFSSNLATAALFHERGAAVSGMFHDAPRWTHPAAKLPGDLGALYRFCAEAAAAFGDGVEDWEFWNEPDIHFAPEPVWEYAAAMKVAYLGFKSARPDLPVLNGALCQMPGKSRYFDVFLDNDAAHYFDIYNYHTYLPPAKYPEAFARIRERLAEAGATNCPIWVTEFGTNLEGHSDQEGAKKRMMAHSPEQELVQAEFYPKAQIALMMEGVERAYFFVFAAFNERKGRKDWGVIRRDGTVKPVFAAMATAVRALGDARLLGEVKLGHGLRAYLFEEAQEKLTQSPLSSQRALLESSRSSRSLRDESIRPCQTLVFWAESPLDKATSNAIIKPTPDYATPFTIAAPLREGGGGKADGGSTGEASPLCLIDMCGMVSTVPPSTNGTITLPATRFPSYITGLHGLKADTPPPRLAEPLSHEAALMPRSGHFGVVNADGVDNTIVIRPVLDQRDFAISGGKTLAVMKGDAGRVRIEVWNFSDATRTGIVETAGASVTGLPNAPFAIGPGGCAAFECELRQQSGADAPTARPHGRFVETSLPNAGGIASQSGRDAPTARPPCHDADLALRAVFAGCAPARAVVPVFFEKSFLASCEQVPLETAAPSLWERNSSADEQILAFDEAEGAIRFDAVWHDDLKDRWLYPVRRLVLPGESPVGARRVVFEVKSEQDKVENDYKTCKLMLASGDGKTDIYLDYDPPTREWEKRYVDIPPDTDLTSVTLLRIGANPLGSRCTIWIRDLNMLK